MMIRTLVTASLLSLLCFVSSSCRSGGAVQGSAGGGRQPLDVLIEEGSPAEMTEKQYGLRKELRTAMERDLPRRLARQGFDMRLITSPTQNTGKETDAPLLIVRYEAYNPGSSAARMWVGYGAGAASLDLSMTLGKGGKEIATWKDGCGTSQHWSRIINTLDDRMSKKVKTLLVQ
jgi:Domain of unknown function (DUF4410)